MPSLLKQVRTKIIVCCFP